MEYSINMLILNMILKRTMKNKKIILFISLSLFVLFVFYEVNRSSKIPDHIHSIDDKPAEQRTDEENITVLKRTLQSEPENIKALMEISDLYIKTGNHDLAEKYLEEILDLDPANAEAVQKLNKLKNH